MKKKEKKRKKIEINVLKMRNNTKNKKLPTKYEYIDRNLKYQRNLKEKKTGMAGESSHTLSPYTIHI